MTEKEITPKEIMLPVLVLSKRCADCDRLDIRVNTNKLYADGELARTANEFRCTNLYECKQYAEMVQKIMIDDWRDNDGTDKAGL